MTLSENTKIHDLLETYPFLEDFLASYNKKFEMLRNKMARATIGRLATLRTAAGIADLNIDALLEGISAEIEKKMGQSPVVERAESTGFGREHRIRELREIIRFLHEGGDLEQARERFARAVEDVEASEIAEMEEELIRDGLPVSEVQRLCDVHVGAFKHALDEHTDIEAPLGHPIRTYMEDNLIITRLANQLGSIANTFRENEVDERHFTEAMRVVNEIGGIENHYRRKENQLFPILERHGVTGPSQVMWGVHDQIRAGVKIVREALEKRNVKEFVDTATTLARDIVEMIYKEEKILFPLALETMEEKEWTEVRVGEDELGYELATPGAPWPGQGSTSKPQISSTGDLLALTTGEMSLSQVNLVFRHLPVDLSFVDENDEVRFYSEGPDRIFPRSPAVIGRKVINCHPPKSMHIVQEILDSFRAGKRNTADFWIQMQGKFIYIRYFAVRDEAGFYRGCLEVSQDVTRIRELQGEKRLLD